MDWIHSLFPPLYQLPAIRKLPEECQSEGFPSQDFSFSALVQLLFFVLLYGTIVLNASNLIVRGTELLLLLPRIAPLVGNLILPIVASVPDSLLMLFSGMGNDDKVQAELAVGIGALAGSTILTLTLPWFVSIWYGRVDIKDGRAAYRQLPKLSGRQSIWATGVQPDQTSIRLSTKQMLFTLVPYILIQGAALGQLNSTDEEAKSRIVSNFALVGLIACGLAFLGYVYSQLTFAVVHHTVVQDITDDIRLQAVNNGLISLRGMFLDILKEKQASVEAGMLEENLLESSGMSPSEMEHYRFHKLLHRFFLKYDTDGSGSIDRQELAYLLKDLHIPHRDEEVDCYLQIMDTDHSGEISFEEFKHAFADIVMNSENQAVARIIAVPQETALVGESEEEKEDTEMPTDLVELPAEVQRRMVLQRSFASVMAGLVFVFMFTDPLIDVFVELGNVCGVSSFYVSFVLAPLVSCASEIMASTSYASRKTTKTITMSFCSLLGSIVLNNTFVLGVFLAIVKSRGVQWEYSAETISVLFVQVCVGVVAWKTKVFTVQRGCLLLILFPLSLALVVFLQSDWVGID